MTNIIQFPRRNNHICKICNEDLKVDIIRKYTLMVYCPNEHCVMFARGYWVKKDTWEDVDNGK